MCRLAATADSVTCRMLAVQEFEGAMLDLMAGNTTRKARRRCQKMVGKWFVEIDMDDSGFITFDEFLAWYQRSVGAARAQGIM